MNIERPTVLVVDDDVSNLYVIMEALKDQYVVVTATNGTRALNKAIAAPLPDIILLDVMMPDISGYDVCTKLKGNEATRGVPVIFVTALSEIGDETKGLELGAVDYITKPINPSLVKARVRNQLELKRHRDRLEAMVRERTKELVLTQQATIEMLADLAETRDPETGCHIKRTQEYVCALAHAARQLSDLELFMDDESIDMLYHSAVLHDIGKVGVPDAILNKEGKLSKEEFSMMKEHCIIGYKAMLGAQRKLGENSFLRLAGEIALTHHERWNGTGYPRGLSGAEIPISGRIVAVADVYDALVCQRIYKPPFTHKEAVNIIVGESGKQFDPRFVKAFLAIESQIEKISVEYADYKA
ncbi:HD domain-containing phosphohydrolase [uncultured Desulfovibrio sp.]|uniref:HD domain-containing phosphohydrolase n=1 Tax=uncultured Desulfovibrio sp. TaxID=167968 RepID=UPI002618CBEE|nr:HD domain-containing phosphohydrolase [uncultured Desulfovibrio sp.]